MYMLLHDFWIIWIFHVIALYKKIKNGMLYKYFGWIFWKILNFFANLRSSKVFIYLFHLRFVHSVIIFNCIWTRGKYKPWIYIFMAMLSPILSSGFVVSFRYLFFFVLLRVFWCRQQDEELDELSASVQRIGGVGLTIHEELLAQVFFHIQLISAYRRAVLSLFLLGNHATNLNRSYLRKKF